MVSRHHYSPSIVATRLKHQCILGAMVSLLVSPAALAQQTIHGVIAQLETVTRIERATVLVVGADGVVYGATLSDSAGRFVIGVPTGGNYTLRVHRVGYEGTESDPIEVPANTAVEVRVNLRPDPTMLEALTVYGEVPQTRELRQFHGRREQYWGYSFTQADFERLGVTRLPEILPEIPGARIRGNNSRERIVQLNHRRCDPAVFVDGRESQLPFLELSEGFPLGYVYGIEVFREWGDVPVEYAAPRRRLASCGVILIWTMIMRR